MALLKKLNEVRKVKQDYFMLQRRFFSELSHRFPYIMNVDMAKVINQLDDELQTMLCCSLKYKSIKIPLTAHGVYKSSDVTTLSVQRSQKGFYYPFSQRGTSDLHYMNMKNVLVANDRIEFHGSEYLSGSNTHRKFVQQLVELSEIKRNPKQVYMDKLSVYFKVLREVMAYRKQFLRYAETKLKPITFTTDELGFNIGFKAFDLCLVEYFKEMFLENRFVITHNFAFKDNKESVYHLLDYSGYNRERITKGNHIQDCFSANSHIILKHFINNYHKIIPILEREEKRKRNVVHTCRGYINQLSKYTIPFKVLGELTN